MFFFNDTATTEIYTLSLHDALPISFACCSTAAPTRTSRCSSARRAGQDRSPPDHAARRPSTALRSEEHTSELQSRQYLVCRLLLEKKKNTIAITTISPLFFLCNSVS